MKRPLFRKEVLEAQRVSHLGSISLAQPLRLWVLAAVAIAIVAILLAVLFLGEYSRRSRVTGQLVPDLGLSSVMAPTAGVVARIYQAEGAQVAAGSPLIRIEVPRTLSDGKAAVLAATQALDAQAEGVRLGDAATGAQMALDRTGLTAQLAQLRRELQQTEQAIATRQSQVQLAQSTLDRFNRIADTHVVSRVQVEQQQQALLEWVNQRQALERQATALRRSMLQTEQTLQKLPAQRQLQQATVQQQLAELQQQRVQQQANGEVLLQAPVAGLLATQLIEAGQGVQAGQPLLSLLPEGSQLQAQLLVPSRAIGFVRPGDAVLLRYQAYPYQKFGHALGRVARISRSAASPEELSKLAGQHNLAEPYYRVLVALDSQSILAYGKAEPLRPGMQLEADIVGERRKLYEWLLEPLYALSGKIQ